MTRAFRTEQSLGNIRLDTGGAPRTRLAPTSANTFGGALNNLGGLAATLSAKANSSGRREGRFLSRLQDKLATINNSSEFKRVSLLSRAEFVKRFGVARLGSYDAFIKQLNAPKISLNKNESGAFTLTSRNFLNRENTPETFGSKQEREIAAGNKEAQRVIQRQSAEFVENLPETSKAIDIIAAKIGVQRTKDGNPKPFGTGPEFAPILKAQNAFVDFHVTSQHIKKMLLAASTSSADMRISLESPEFKQEFTERFTTSMVMALSSLRNPQLLQAAAGGKLKANDIEVMVGAVFSDIRNTLQSDNFGKLIGLDIQKVIAVENAYRDAIVKQYAGIEARKDASDLARIRKASAAASLADTRLRIQINRLKLKQATRDEEVNKIAQAGKIARAHLDVAKVYDEALARAGKGGPSGEMAEKVVTELGEDIDKQSTVMIQRQLARLATKNFTVMKSPNASGADVDSGKVRPEIDGVASVKNVTKAIEDVVELFDNVTETSALAASMSAEDFKSLIDDLGGRAERFIVVLRAEGNAELAAESAERVFELLETLEARRTAILGAPGRNRDDLENSFRNLKRAIVGDRVQTFLRRRKDVLERDAKLKKTIGAEGAAVGGTE